MMMLGHKEWADTYKVSQRPGEGSEGFQTHHVTSATIPDLLKHSCDAHFPHALHFDHAAQNCPPCEIRPKQRGLTRR
jgi:hypothetical protein